MLKTLLIGLSEVISYAHLKNVVSPLLLYILDNVVVYITSGICLYKQHTLSLMKYLNSCCNKPSYLPQLQNLVTNRKHFGLHTALLLSPIIGGGLLAPSYTNSAFKIRLRNSIKYIKDLCLNDNFGSFEQLSKSFNLPKAHFFRYLLILHFTNKFFCYFPSSSPSLPFR